MEYSPIGAKTESEFSETGLGFANEKGPSNTAAEQIFGIAPVNGTMVPALPQKAGTRHMVNDTSTKDPRSDGRRIRHRSIQNT